MTPLTLRTTIYSLTLFFGFSQLILCSIFARNWYKGVAPYLYILQGTAIGWAVVTCIWTSVLLAFNNRPLSKHTLTGSLLHFTLFTVFAVGWLVLIIPRVALAIGMATQFPLQCNFVTYSDGKAYEWCASGESEFAVSLLLWLCCSASAITIYRGTRKLGGLATNLNVVDCDSVTAEERAPT